MERRRKGDHGKGDLFEATWEPRWLREALALQEVLGRHYRKPKGGGYFMTSDDHETIPRADNPGCNGWNRRPLADTIDLVANT